MRICLKTKKVSLIGKSKDDDISNIRIRNPPLFRNE